MKFKVVAIGLIAANFTFTSVAQSQQYGYGLYGGNQQCGYPNGPAKGASSEDDDRAELVQQKRDLQAELRDVKHDINGYSGDPGLKKDVAELREKIEKRFDPLWAETFLLHMDHRNNCRICGDDLAPPRSRPQPPPVQTAAPQPIPEQTAAPQPVPVQTAAPQPVPVQNAAPQPVPVQTAAPQPVPVQTAAPQPVPVQTAKPQPLPEQTAKPDPAKSSAPKITTRPISVKPAGDPAAVDTAKRHSDCVTAIAASSGKKWKAMSAAQQATWCSNNGDHFAINDSTQSHDRMPASVSNSSRMPASARFTDGETVGAGGGRPQSGGQPSGGQQTAPVQAQTDAPQDGWASKPDFEIGSGSSYNGGDTGPANCYDRNTEPYMRKSWRGPHGACRPDGQLNPEICRTPNYLADPSSVRDYYACQEDLKKYRKASEDLEKAETKKAGLEEDIKTLKQQLKDFDREQRHDKNERDRDDATLEASASRRRSGGGGGSTGPSIGRTLLGLAAGVGVGYGLESLNRSGYDRNYRIGANADEALGWQPRTYNYQSNGLGVAAGMGVFGAIAGGQNGSFGCGQMNTAQMNGNVFGNPYVQNPYSQLGGGIYNTMPGYPGSNMGNYGGYPSQFNAGIGAQFGTNGYPNQFGANGYPNQFGNNGYPNQFGLGAQFGVNGYPNQYGNNGYQNQFGVGAISQYGLGGGGYQQQLAQMQYEQYIRSQAVNSGYSAQASELQAKMGEIQGQLNGLGNYNSQYSFGASGYAYPASYSYPSSSVNSYYDPSIYGNSIVTTPAVLTPTRTLSR